MIDQYYRNLQNEKEWKEIRERQEKIEAEKLSLFCDKIKKIETTDFYYGVGDFSVPFSWRDKEYREDRRFYQEKLEEKLYIIKRNSNKYLDEYHDCFDEADGKRISWKKGINIICGK